MQTTKIMGIIALAFVLLVPLVFAEEALVTTLSEEPLTTDNTEAPVISEVEETVSDGEIFREKLGLFFTFNQEKRAEKELKLAKMELIKAKIALKNNNTIAMQKALDAHDRLIENVQNKIQNKKEQSDKKDVEKSVEWLSGIEKAVDAHESKVERLNLLLANNTNLSEEEIANINARIEKSQLSITHLKEVEANKQERIKTKLMAIGNMSEEEADAKIEELKDSENFSGMNRNQESQQRNKREDKPKINQEEKIRAEIETEEENQSENETD